MNFIIENKGVISVESGKQLIEFSVEDFAIFFNKRNTGEYWQFPTKWKKKESSTTVSGNTLTNARLKIPTKNEIIILLIN